MRPSLQDDQPQARTLRVRSVVGLAHDEIRSMIVSGAIAPGSRLGQGELADQLGISEGNARVSLYRARKRYRRVLEELIADTVADEGEVEDDLFAGLDDITNDNVLHCLLMMLS